MAKKNKIKNKIEIDLSEFDEVPRKFILSTIKRANKWGVKVTLLNERSIRYTESADADDEAGLCNGFFCNEEMELACACDQPFDNWFRVFVHESSHMDQWHEDDPYWETINIGEVDTGTLLDLWINHHIELNSEQLHKVLMPSVFVELDCERRALKKILKYNLPLDPKRYAKLANAYVWLYLVMPFTRRWYKIGNEPYNNENIIDFMPEHLNMDYEGEVPKEIIKLYKDNL